MVWDSFSPRKSAVFMTMVIGIGTAVVALARTAAAVHLEQSIEVPQCAGHGPGQSRGGDRCGR